MTSFSLTQNSQEAGAKALSELAVSHPGASRVFHRRGIDYCCGGKRTLSDACRDLNLDVDEVVRDILDQDVPEGSQPNWEERPLEELVEFIVERYHKSLRTEIPDLILLAEKVEDRHRDKEACPHGLAQHLKNVHRAVLEHLAKEEQVLFPMIQSGQGKFSSGPVAAMEHEHREHAVNLGRIRELAKNFELPAEACTSWKALYLRLEQLEAELMEHIHLENNILFPRALCE